ncbi:MAG: hypothetical protein JXB49_28980 [Bacteroidales bacterium]|nr:hypothetical protein [Bacteroidales bacterium]
MPIFDTSKEDKQYRMKKKGIKDENLKRINRQSLMLNNHELNALQTYCKKYRVSNKSKFMREAIITAVLKKFDEDHPTLFDDPQLTLFS